MQGRENGVGFWVLGVGLGRVVCKMWISDCFAWRVACGRPTLSSHSFMQSHLGLLQIEAHFTVDDYAFVSLLTNNNFKRLFEGIPECPN